MMSPRHFDDNGINDVDGFVRGATQKAKKHSKKSSSDDTTVTSMRLRKSTHKRLKGASVDMEISIQEIVDQAVNEYLNQKLNVPQAIDTNSNEDDGL